MHVIEFSTPEETRRCLGRIIVGAPHPADEPFDVDIVFTLQRGATTEEHGKHVTRATEALIVDTPFPFQGEVNPTRWSAGVNITWRGRLLTHTYRSQALFPTIHAWQACVYHPEDQPLALQQGEDILDLDWRACLPRTARTQVRQAPDGLINLAQPYSVILSAEHSQGQRAGIPLAGYLATTITSPSDREVVLLFRGSGSAAVGSTA
jgi:hypothetical protein